MIEQTNAAGVRYRFKRLTLPLVLADLRFELADPGPGDPMPSFDLPKVDGGRFQSDQFSRHDGSLIVFGSASCPVTDHAVPDSTG